MSDDEDEFQETFGDRERVENQGVCASLGITFDQKTLNSDPRQRRLGEACVLMLTMPSVSDNEIRNVITKLQELKDLESLNMQLAVAAILFTKVKNLKVEKVAIKKFAEMYLFDKVKSKEEKIKRLTDFVRYIKLVK